MCDSNNYSKTAANTGINLVTAANSNLNGSGTVYTILSAGATGTILKSVIIKATGQTLAGMIRLYIKNTGATVLIDEIPIPPYPSSITTPTPPVVLQTFVSYKVYGLMMNDGDSLVVSSQNTGSFNVIAEALDVSYESPVPDVCCSFKQVFPASGIGVVSTANPETDGTGSVISIFTSPNSNSGTLIKSVTITALESTDPGMVRLFVNNGTNNFLMNEIYVPQSVQSSAQRAFQIILPQYYNLKAGYSIAASTQNAQSFGIKVAGETWSYPV
jgi:hypothetical protein